VKNIAQWLQTFLVVQSYILELDGFLGICYVNWGSLYPDLLAKKTTTKNRTPPPKGKKTQTNKQTNKQTEILVLLKTFVIL
jgi:hypothetical protein